MRLVTIIAALALAPPAAAQEQAGQPPAGRSAADAIAAGMSRVPLSVDDAPSVFNDQSDETEEFDDSVRANADVATRLQGPLDGGWVLSAQDGRQLYRFQLAETDPAAPPEGAWRDLQAAKGASSSGFIAAVSRSGPALVLRFIQTGPSDTVVVSLAPAGYGRWTGQLQRNGTTVPVQLQRAP